MMLKNDPSFIYRSLKICSLCYDSVKAMLVFQSNEQIKNKNTLVAIDSTSAKQGSNSAVTSVQEGKDGDKFRSGTPTRLDPIKQSWMISDNS